MHRGDAYIWRTSGSVKMREYRPEGAAPGGRVSGLPPSSSSSSASPPPAPAVPRAVPGSLNRIRIRIGVSTATSTPPTPPALSSVNSSPKIADNASTSSNWDSGATKPPRMVSGAGAGVGGGGGGAWVGSNGDVGLIGTWDEGAMEE